MSSHKLIFSRHGERVPRERWHRKKDGIYLSSSFTLAAENLLLTECIFQSCRGNMPVNERVSGKASWCKGERGQEKTEDYQPWKQVLEVGFCLLLSSILFLFRLPSTHHQLWITNIFFICQSCDDVRYGSEA